MFSADVCRAHAVCLAQICCLRRQVLSSIVCKGIHARLQQGTHGLQNEADEAPSQSNADVIPIGDRMRCLALPGAHMHGGGPSC